MKKKNIVFIAIGIALFFGVLLIINYWKRPYYFKFDYADIANVYVISYWDNSDYLYNYESDTNTVRVIAAEQWEDIYNDLKNIGYKSYSGCSGGLKTYSEILVCFRIKNGDVYAYGYVNILENVNGKEKRLRYSVNNKIFNEFADKYIPGFLESVRNPITTDNY